MRTKHIPRKSRTEEEDVPAPGTWFQELEAKLTVEEDSNTLEGQWLGQEAVEKAK